MQRKNEKRKNATKSAKRDRPNVNGSRRGRYINIIGRRRIDVTPYYCYAIILTDNLEQGEFIPAYIICWDPRRSEDKNKRLFMLKKITALEGFTPVLTNTPEDVYEFAEKFKNFRITLRNKKRARKCVYMYGALFAIQCDATLNRLKNIVYYIDTINNKKGGRDTIAAEWREKLVEKERARSNPTLLEVITYEDGIKYGD